MGHRDRMNCSVNVAQHMFYDEDDTFHGHILVLISYILHVF